MSEYYAPKNFNFWYYFGSLALLVLVLQIVTGIFLTMSYKPSATEAFASVEYIMRDVEWGWLIRYLHSTGASVFFIVVYLHMFRALLYGSHRKPRELLWIFGVLIYLALMAEAFFGYLLPWGNMSYWGAQVIVSLFGTFPLIGDALIEWIRGDYFISDITLNRFFALHVVALPLVLVFLVVVHILALHEVGSNNPDGIEIKKNKGAGRHPLDGIPFHPYYTVKDLFGLGVFLVLFAAVVFFAPEMGGLFLEPPNFEPANPLLTPPHIAPVWYFTPYYAILRAVPAFLDTQVWGVLALFAAVAAAVLRAVARPLAGQVDPLPRPDLQGRADAVRGELHRARLLRHEAGGAAVQGHLGRRHAHLLRVLPADAVVLAHRQHQAGAGAGDVHEGAARAPRRARRHARGRVRVGSGLSAAGSERGRLEPRLAAARRAQLRQLLPGLPFGEVHALQPARHGPRAHRGRACRRT